MTDARTLHPATLAVHAGAEPDPGTGAVAPPIHLSTTFRHGPAGERLAGYEYQREGNPTQDRLEAALAMLEGGARALAYASGMAAITGVLDSLPRGSRLLIPDDCYSGLRYLAREFLPERGIDVDPPGAAGGVRGLTWRRSPTRAASRWRWCGSKHRPIPC